MYGGMLIVRREPAVERGVRMIAGEHVVIGGAVPGVAVRERADERELVHHPRDARQLIADVDARHIGRARLKGAADRVGRVGLHVERVNRAQPAAEEDEDQRGVAARVGERLSAQQASK